MRKIAMAIGLTGLAACAPYVASGPVSLNGNLEVEVLAVYGGDGPLQQGGARINAWQTIKMVDRFSGAVGYSANWTDGTRAIALYLRLLGQEAWALGFGDGVERNGTNTLRYRIDGGEIETLTLEFDETGGLYFGGRSIIDDFAAGGEELEVQIGEQVAFTVSLERVKPAVDYATTLCEEGSS